MLCPSKYFPSTWIHLFSWSIYFWKQFSNSSKGTPNHRSKGISRIVSFQIDDIWVLKTENSRRGPGLAKMEDVVGQWPSLTSKTQSQGVPCLSGCIIMQESEVLKSCFQVASFVLLLQFSLYNIFIELCCDCSAFWHWNLHEWTLIIEENYIQNHYCSCSFGNNWTSRIFVAQIWLEHFRFGSK